MIDREHGVKAIAVACGAAVLTLGYLAFESIFVSITGMPPIRRQQWGGECREEIGLNPACVLDFFRRYFSEDRAVLNEREVRCELGKLGQYVA